MSLQLNDDDVIARLRAGAPGYPEGGPDAGRTLAAARRALRRRRGRWAIGSVAAVVAVVIGVTAAGPMGLPGVGGFVPPGQQSADTEDPPLRPRETMLNEAAQLERQVLPVVEDLGLTLYIDDQGGWGRPACRVFTWSHGAFRDRDPECVNPDDPELTFDSASDDAFARVSAAIDASGVNVFRIEQGGWGPGTSFHLEDNSWMWNWYYSYVPGTPADAPNEVREQTRLGVRLQVHVTGNWWFTVEPDD